MSQNALLQGREDPKGNLCNKMFKDSSGTIAKTWKEPKYPPTDEQIKKMWYIYTMDYYPAIKKE